MSAALLAMLCLTHFGISQEAPKTISGATVDSVNYDPATGVAQIVVRNSSGKEISAINLTITTKLPDGSLDHTQVTIDFLPSTIAEESFGLVPPPNSTVIQPGNTHVEDVHVGTVNGQKPTSVGAVVDMVAFMDRTAEAANKDALDRLVSDRKAMGTALLDAAGVVRKHLQATGEQNPEENSRLEVQQHQKNSQSAGRVAYDSVLEDIKNAKRASAQGSDRGRERLDNATKARERQGRLYLTHAVLGGAQ
jgi:hypothetical protein